MTHSHLNKYHSLDHYNSHTTYEHNINSNHNKNIQRMFPSVTNSNSVNENILQTLHNMKHNKYIHISHKLIFFASIYHLLIQYVYTSISSVDPLLIQYVYASISSVDPVCTYMWKIIFVLQQMPFISTTLVAMVTSQCAGATAWSDGRYDWLWMKYFWEDLRVIRIGSW